MGGKLAQGGTPPWILTGVTPLLATVGLVAIAVELSSTVFAVSVVLMAAGFALPYARMMIEAQKLFPQEPTRPTSALTMLSNVIAIPMVPVLGALLDSGDGEVGFLALGMLVLAAGLANLRSVDKPLT